MAPILRNREKQTGESIKTRIHSRTGQCEPSGFCGKIILFNARPHLLSSPPGRENDRWTIPVLRRMVRPIPARVFQKDGGRFSISANGSWEEGRGEVARETVFGGTRVVSSHSGWNDGTWNDVLYNFSFRWTGKRLYQRIV